MTLQELMEQRKEGHVTEPMIGEYVDVIAEQYIQEARNKHYGLNPKDQEQAVGVVSHETAVNKVVESLELAPIKSPRLDIHIAIYKLRELYRRKTVGDIGESALKASLKDLAPKKEITGKFSIEESEHLLLYQSFAQEKSFGFQNQFSQEYSIYWFISELERKGNDEDLSQQFEEFLRQYCVVNKDKINGRYPSIRNLVENYEKGEKVNFSEDDKTLNFVLDAGERDLLLHIMLIKYFEYINDRRNISKVCNAATNHFKNEPWFVYRYAENVRNSDTDFVTAQNKLLGLEKSDIEKDKLKLHRKIGDFYFRTAEGVNSFKQASENYEEALKEIRRQNAEYLERTMRDMAPGETIKLSIEITTKKADADECLKAARVVEKLINPRKEPTLEERSSNWETIKENYNTIVGALTRNDLKDHPYLGQVGNKVKAYAEKLIVSWRDKIKLDEVNSQLFEDHLKDLEERCKKASGEIKKSYNIDIDSVGKSVEQKRYRLNFNKETLSSLVDSAKEIFPDIDNPLKPKNGG